ncbi:c-type cytochrome [Massilia aurea]|uniref:c-type cytochrome n=1 Tax=Massilia aurea TaxID=373040 RepID=UPI002161A7D2|nr:c-type cytochrome [Massilia aurea]
MLRASLPTRLTTGALLCAAVLASGCAKEEPASRVSGGDPERGRLLVQQYQCAACHFIPEVQGPNGDAGPSLESMGRLSYIAGSIPNQPENMIRFLQNPPAVKPGTLMPALGITDDEARHMAAFMYSLK